MSDLPPKQLSMEVSAAAIARLPAVSVPGGYVLRTYRPGDEASWAALNVAAGFKEWDTAKVEGYLKEPERRAGSYLVDCGGEAVAATFATRGEGEQVGPLDYVVCHPQHQNKKLGRAVCTAVLRFWAGRGCGRVTLLTDDWRLPAIKLYHNLGFVPVWGREDMPGRWRAIYAELGVDGPAPPAS